jgi:hypothetical protein
MSRLPALAALVVCSISALVEAAPGDLIGSYQSGIRQENFGQEVTLLDGKYVVIGAPGIASGGRVYAFEALTGRLLQTYINPSITGGDSFGSDTAALGVDRIIVGARGNRPGQAFAMLTLRFFSVQEDFMRR